MGEIPEDVLDEVEEALVWIAGRQSEAKERLHMVHGPEDTSVRGLCTKYGYGAIMDSAARQWGENDNSGAFFIGGCLGDTSVANALTRLRAAREGK